jgi:hypothetical protein
LRFSALILEETNYEKYFYGVFELLMQRNGQKRDKKQIEVEKRQDFFFSQLFWQKVFDIDFPQWGVFLNSPSSETHKKSIESKVNKKKKGIYLR